MAELTYNTRLGEYGSLDVLSDDSLRNIARNAILLEQRVERFSCERVGSECSRVLQSLEWGIKRGYGDNLFLDLERNVAIFYKTVEEGENAANEYGRVSFQELGEFEDYTKVLRLVFAPMVGVEFERLCALRTQINSYGEQGLLADVCLRGNNKYALELSCSNRWKIKTEF